MYTATLGAALRPPCSLPWLTACSQNAFLKKRPTSVKTFWGHFQQNFKLRVATDGAASTSFPNESGPSANGEPQGRRSSFLGRKGKSGEVGSTLRVSQLLKVSAFLISSTLENSGRTSGRSRSICIGDHKYPQKTLSTYRSQRHIKVDNRASQSPIVSKAPTPGGPEKTVKIYCGKCEELLYLYRKAGKGALIKCFVERIAKDYTKGDMKCPQCSTEFARPAMIRGKPAHKIIGGKVTMRK